MFLSACPVTPRDVYIYSVVNRNLLALPGALERKCRNKSRFEVTIFKLVAASSNKTRYQNDRYLSNIFYTYMTKVEYIFLLCSAFIC